MASLTCAVRLQRACGVAAPRAPRPRALAPRASKEADLKAMQEFKAGLGARLQESSRPGSTAAATGGAAAETETAAAPVEGKHLREVTQEDFYEAIAAAGDKLVIVDCFTQWCGPCKMILPQLVLLAEELEGKAEIIKFECNKANKELGMKLGIKVAPTFLLFRGGQEVDRMTGAKVDQLRELIEKHL